MNVENIFVEQYLFNPFKIQSKYINSYYEAAHLGGPNSRFLLSSIKGRYMNINIIKALQEINNSIYIVGGVEEDNIKEISDGYVYYNPSIEASFINDTKHLPQIEKPKALLNQINIFFS